MKLAVVFVLAATVTAVAQPATSSADPPVTSAPGQSLTSASEPPAAKPIDSGRRLYVAFRGGVISTAVHLDGDDDGDPATNGSGSGWVADFEIGARLGRTEAGGYLEIWHQPAMALVQSFDGFGAGYRGRYRAVAGLYIGGGIGYAIGTGTGVVFTANGEISYRLPKIGPLALELTGIVQGGYFPPLPLPEGGWAAASMLSGRLELGVVF